MSVAQLAQGAVMELYDTIQKAVAGIDGNGVDRQEIGHGLGSMTEAP
jgi:hypothetical protein